MTHFTEKIKNSSNIITSLRSADVFRNDVITYHVRIKDTTMVCLITLEN